MAIIQREIRYLTTEELLRLRRHAEARAFKRESGVPCAPSPPGGSSICCSPVGCVPPKSQTSRSGVASWATARPRWCSATARRVSNVRCFHPPGT